MSKTGTVISSPEGPSSVEFSFVINGKNAVRKGQFVELESEEGRLIARVVEIFKTNRYFERASSVSEYEKSGKPINSMFPTERWEYLVGKAEVLGLFNGTLIQRPAFPASPGTSVYPASRDKLVPFLGLDTDDGLHIGTLEYQNIDAKINMTKLLQKHLAILAMSGAGKSYTVSVLIEELLDRTREHGQVAVVVADPHGDYLSFAEDERYLKKVNVLRGKDVKISISGFSAENFAGLISDARGVQLRHLDRVLKNLKEKTSESGGFTLDELIETVSLDEKINTNTKQSMLNWLGDLKRLGIFGKFDNPSIKDIEQGKLTILDLSDLNSLKVRQIIVAAIAGKLFSGRQSNTVPPFVLFVEEAHNFAPSKTKKEAAISGSIIRKIAREGRKFHACLCLISQRPVNLSTTALSQCNTHIIMRVMNPYDLEHISQSSEGITSHVKNQLSGLRTGEAVIVGEAVNYPFFMKIRKRKSKEPMHSKELKDAAVDFSRNNDKQDKDAETFI